MPEGVYCPCCHSLIGYMSPEQANTSYRGTCPFCTGPSASDGTRTQYKALIKDLGYWLVDTNGEPFEEVA